MPFKIKKKTSIEEIPYDSRKEWCLKKERELGIGKNMQLMPTDIRIQVIKRKQAEKEIIDKKKAEREKENAILEQKRIQWRKKWGITSLDKNSFK